jgi:hypothetical protein
VHLRWQGTVLGGGSTVNAGYYVIEPHYWSNDKGWLAKVLCDLHLSSKLPTTSASVTNRWRREPTYVRIEEHTVMSACHHI